MGIRRNRTAVAACAAAGALTVALAACGSSGTAGPAATPQPSGSAQSAAGTVAAMKAAVRSAHSVHLTGRLAGTGGKTVGLDIGLLRSGEFAGTISQGGVPETIVSKNGTVYIKATRAFLSQLHVPAAVCTLMCGKYVALATDKSGQLRRELSMPALLRSFTAKMPVFTSAGTQTVNGQAAKVLRGADGSTLAVAATGPPYPLLAISPHHAHGRLSFSQWNTVPAPVAPPPGQVINLNQLGGV